MYGAFMVVGWLASRKVRDGTAADLIVAGRAMPLWIAALTMTATWVDGGYLLGTTEGAYKTSIQLGIQGGLCFGISLILGGLFFAGIMRRFGFTTLIDPFEARFGKRWAAVLFLPALAGELFWSAELLVAIGSTFGVLLGMPLTTAILLVRGRDDGLHRARRHVVGGLHRHLSAGARRDRPAASRCRTCWTAPADCARLGRRTSPRARRAAASFRRWQPHTDLWNARVDRRLVGHVADADVRRHPVELLFPARAVVPHAARRARGQSMLAGVLTIAFTVPPLLMGVAAFAYPWPADVVARLQATPADAMPLLFARAVPPRDRPARPRGDHRRRDVQLQLVDPVGGIDAELELPEAAGLAVAVGRRR